MIQDDRENTASEPVPLGTFIHLLAWAGRIFLALTGIWIIGKIISYGACTYTLIIVISLVIVFSLLEKLSSLRTNKEVELPDANHEKLIPQNWTYDLVTIPFMLVIAGFGLYGVIIFISTFFQFLVQAPLLLVIILIVAPIIILMFNWLMDLKFRSK